MGGLKINIRRKIKLRTPLETEKQLDTEVEKFVNDIKKSSWKSLLKLELEIRRELKGKNYPREILEFIGQKPKARKTFNTADPRKIKLF